MSKTVAHPLAAVLLSLPLLSLSAERQSSTPQPVAAPVPEVSENTGAGPVWDSSPSQWPGHGVGHYDYAITEYTISGTAAGKPYDTRMVIRRPADDARFSGLVIAEAMHPVGRAHAFQFNSVYIMASGHIAVEVSTRGVEQLAAFNPDRYGGHRLEGDQINEILAQAGALIKSGTSPIADLNPRKMVLWGTSASSRILTDYLPAHAVFKTAEMENIYDGFMPTSNGSDIEPVDVPMIQVPTQHEFRNMATAAQDGDAPGEQFRVYEFPGMGHLMARHNTRLGPGSCVRPLTRFPLEPYMSVALHHLLEWVDRGIAPPMADRVLIDRNTANDGSLMALDPHGNPMGGIRSPYVDVPAATYIAGNEAVDPSLATQCRLTVWERAFSRQELRELYGTRENYVRRFEAALDRQEEAGWSLPLYRDLIMEDARAVGF